jgi:hypothetical protein
VEPLSDENIRALAERYAALVNELGLDAGEPLLVLPNGEFFPDTFRGDQAGVEALCARMQGYAGLERLNLSIELADDGSEPAGGGCGTGGCGTGACATPPAAKERARLERNASGWLLRVPTAELRNPIVLTSRLATLLGAVALLERHPEGEALASDPIEAELTAAALGFGVLLLEASYLYSKSCGGPNVQRATALGCDELAVLLALAAARDGHSLKPAFAELGTTQRALLSEAKSTLDASPTLTQRLCQQPERVARGDFKLRDGGSIFARLFRKKPAQKAAADREAAALRALERGASLDELEALVAPVTAKKPAAPKTPAAAGNDDDIRALVDEALREVRAEP